MVAVMTPNVFPVPEVSNRRKVCHQKHNSSLQSQSQS
jgi:hypothetical protein